MPGYDVGVWFGVLTVAGTPPDVVQRLNTEMVKILTSAEIKERFGKMGVEVVAGTPEHFSGFLKSEVDRWAQGGQGSEHQGRLMADASRSAPISAWSTVDRIVVRGKDLPNEILGHLNLGDMAFLELTGRVPDAKESKLFNAMAVTLVEHGMTPSAHGRPPHLPRRARGDAGRRGRGPARAGQRVRRLDRRAWRRCSPRRAGRSKSHRPRSKRIPGLGHPMHKPVDPRTVRLFEIARETGFYGKYCKLMEEIAQARRT